MKHFQLTGGTKKDMKVIENYLDKIDFEKKMSDIIVESMIFGIEFEETKAYNKLLEEIRWMNPKVMQK